MPAFYLSPRREPDGTQRSVCLEVEGGPRLLVPAPLQPHGISGAGFQTGVEGIP
jgi:hypothetical protein